MLEKVGEFIFKFKQLVKKCICVSDVFLALIGLNSVSCFCFDFSNP